MLCILTMFCTQHELFTECAKKKYCSSICCYYLYCVTNINLYLIIIVECPCFNAGADWVTLVAIFNCQMSTEVCLSNLGSEASVCVCVHLQIFSLTIEPSTSSVGLECNSWILIVLWIHRLTEACWSELRIGCWRLCLLFLLHLL